MFIIYTQRTQNDYVGQPKGFTVTLVFSVFGGVYVFFFSLFVVVFFCDQERVAYCTVRLPELAQFDVTIKTIPEDHVPVPH